MTPRLIATLLLLAAVGCTPSSTPEGGQPLQSQSGDLIATWDERLPIYQSDYQSWLAWRGEEPAPQHLSDFATGMALAHLARERGPIDSGPDADEVALQVRQHILGEALLAHVDRSTTVDDSRVEAELLARGEDYQQPRRYQLRNIFMMLPSDPKEQAVTRARMEALRARAIGGEDFATLASEHSQSQTRFREGRVGLLAIDQLPVPVAAAVASLTAGQISPIVESGGGLSIYLCDRVVEAEALDDTSLRQRIRNQLQRQAAVAARAAVDQELLAELGISGSTPGAARRLREARAQRAIDAGLGDSNELALEIRWRTMHELARREMELRAEALRGEDHDAALREAFARMQSRGEGMVRFHVGGIAFGPPDAESLRSAQALLKQISSGETDFETAAREHSIDPSAASDGDLGWFNVRTLAARDWMMMRAVRQIEPGELSGLIHSADGLWIYRLHARQSGEQVRFEDVRDELEARLEQRQTQTLQRQVRAAIVRGVEFAEPAAINSRIEITAPNQPVGGD